jgi:signal transduction histidine kinase
LDRFGALTPEHLNTPGVAHFELNLGQSAYKVAMAPIPSVRDARYAKVAVVASLSDVQLASRRAGWLMGAAAAIGVLVLAALGHRVARSITVPVAELAEMAHQIARGDRAARARIHRDDEIGTLASALNSMAARLADYEQEVAEHSRLAAMGQVAARVAHEIRNPLTAIKLQVQLLQESNEDKAGIVPALLNEIQRLELIVAGTLDLSRPAELIKTPYNLNSLVTEFVRLFRPQLEHRGIDVNVSLSPGMPDSLLDADRVKQVALNLMVNAADELPEGGTIRIGTFHDPDEKTLGFCVDDSGPGIEPDLHDQLFVSHRSKKPGGFGFGLPISHELVTLHGGTLTVGRSDLGGARFRVQLPLEVA